MPDSHHRIAPCRPHGSVLGFGRTPGDPRAAYRRGVIAARKGEHDIAVGNIIGSNLFNTLAVVGLAAAIHPMPVASEVLARDAAVMAGLTLLLFVFAWSGRRIIRPEGAVLLTAYAGYTAYLVATAF